MINRWVERIWAGDVSTESLGDGERAGGVVSGWESSSESSQYYEEITYPRLKGMCLTLTLQP